MTVAQVLRYFPESVTTTRLRLGMIPSWKDTGRYWRKRLADTSHSEKKPFEVEKLSANRTQFRLAVVNRFQQVSDAKRA